MNQIESILLQAIQKSLWDSNVAFPPDTDWRSVLEEAARQAVLGIVMDVAPKEEQNAWKGRAGFGTAHFIRILHFQSALCELLQKNGIPMVILKGTAAAIYYPNPMQRTMGDIDFIVPEDSFDRAMELLAANGYEVNENPQYARHIEFCKDGISFEMHRFFSDGDCAAEIDGYIFDGIHRAVIGNMYYATFPMLSSIENGLVLLAHVAHHLREGLGLRQILDWMMYVDRELDDAAWKDAFKDATEKIGLDTLARTATKMCQMYLGLSGRITWCKDADDALCTALLDNLLSSGNFGRKRGKGLKVESTVSHLRRKGLRYLQQAGEHNWKAYHKHKWLKPFAWIYQIGRYAKQGLETKRKGGQIREDIGRGKQRSELYRKLKIGNPKN